MAARVNQKLTRQDRLTARTLKWLPGFAFFIVALPLPLLFLWLRLTAVEDVGAFMLWVFVSLAAGIALGALVVALLLLYRRRWNKELRDRLATDGITVDELPGFTNEMTKNERRTLQQIERQHLLLADAYRETLAARLTATRVAANAKRETEHTAARLQQALKTIQDSSRRTVVEQELRGNGARLARIQSEAEERRAEAEARMQLIEATASRSHNEAEIEIALQRLKATNEQTPLALETARLERETRELIGDDLRLLEPLKKDRT